MCNPARFAGVPEAGERSRVELDRLNALVHGPRADAFTPRCFHPARQGLRPLPSKFKIPYTQRLLDVIAGRSLVESVHARIRDAICRGVLKPNERLNQDVIAERLNVSRQPVNQALLLLKSQGFVTEVGRRGVMVAPLSLQRVADIYQIRGALDRLAAEGAAALAWSEADVAQGRAMLAAGEQALATGSAAAIVQADLDFHRYLYQRSGNALLAEVLDLHFLHLNRAILTVLQAGPEHRRYWDEHRAIFEAVAAGDGARAAQLSVHHVEAAARAFRAHATAGGF